VIALLAVQTGAWVDVVGTGEYERTNVTAVDANGTELATADVRIADSHAKRYVRLSNTESLGPDEGMLFVHDDEDERAFVMREMVFPLDIVFVGANGTVTTIHHASLPADGTGEGDLERYRGTGKYVLEVNRGWTNRTGFDEGDRLRIPGETNGTVEVNETTGADEPSGAGEPGEGDQTSDPMATCTANGTAAAAMTPDERPVVSALDANGTRLGSVRAAVAANGTARFTGLSETESLGQDEGMLFVYGDVGTHTFVMRDMDFPLDIVFAHENGAVTAIHHAPVPPKGRTRAN